MKQSQVLEPNSNEDEGLTVGVLERYEGATERPNLFQAKNYFSRLHSMSPGSAHFNPH